MTAHIIDFINKLNQCITKKDVAILVLNTLEKELNFSFSSFISCEENQFKLISQTGDTSPGRNLFTKEFSEEILNILMREKEMFSLKMQDKIYYFIPLTNGIISFCLANEENFDDIHLKIICELADLYLTKLSYKNTDLEKNKIKTNFNQDSFSGIEENKKIKFSFLDESDAILKGKTWWISNLGTDIALVFMAEASCTSAAAVFLNGYILGQLNSLKSKADISLSPAELLKYLNKELFNFLNKNDISLNAWYGVFNLDAKKVRFSSANFTDPYLIGHELQISVLSTIKDNKNISLGIDLNAEYLEYTSHISSGSKLVIFTKDALDAASNLHEHHDSTWVPKVLETIGSLSLVDMRNSLKGVLSESTSGTGFRDSRLALLLEFPL